MSEPDHALSTDISGTGSPIAAPGLERGSGEARPPVRQMLLQEIQAELRAVSGTPVRSGDRARRLLLWRQLDRIVRGLHYGS